MWHNCIYINFVITTFDNQRQAVEYYYAVQTSTFDLLYIHNVAARLVSFKKEQYIVVKYQHVGPNAYR